MLVKVSFLLAIDLAQGYRTTSPHTWLDSKLSKLLRRDVTQIVCSVVAAG
jgi:hypothetical protein